MSTSAPTQKMVVGLGNPGAKYDRTRHNVGFEVLNRLSQQYFAPAPRTKFEGQYTSITVGSTNLILVWPLTYMNNSGRCVRATADFYKIDLEHELLVVCDDLSLPTGKLRIRLKGSGGGQKGLNDILRVAGNQNVPRLRIGIDRPPPRWEVSDYVLGRFSSDETPVISQAVQAAADAVRDWCIHDIAYCMNQVN